MTHGRDAEIAALAGRQRTIVSHEQLIALGSTRRVIAHEIRAIDRREVKRHQRLWVSSPARAVLELAATGTVDEVTRAIDEGLAHRLFTPNELRAVLARNRPCRGASPLRRFEADFLWRRERLVVEVDGYPFHRGPAAFNRDHEKDLVFRGAGLDGLRSTGDHVEKQLTMVLARIAGELARRAVAD